MNAGTTPTSPYRSRTAKQLVEYLRAEAEGAAGGIYVQTDLLADDVGLSRKELDTLLAQLQGTVPGLTVELHSNAPTTWRISRP